MGSLPHDATRPLHHIWCWCNNIKHLTIITRTENRANSITKWILIGAAPKALCQSNILNKCGLQSEQLIQIWLVVNYGGGGGCRHPLVSIPRLCRQRVACGISMRMFVVCGESRKRFCGLCWSYFFPNSALKLLHGGGGKAICGLGVSCSKEAASLKW